MRVSLLQMPIGDMTQAYTAVPSLTAYLRARDVEVMPMDASLAFGHYWLAPQRLASLLDDVRARLHTIDERGCPGPLWETYVAANAAVETLEPRCERLQDELGRLRTPAILADLDELQPLVRLLQAFNGLIRAAETLAMPGYRALARLDREQASAVLSDPPPVYARFVADVIVPSLRAARPDVVGFSVTYPRQLLSTLLAATAVREALGPVPIVLGGAYLSTVVETLTLRPEIRHLWDYAVDGEGESALHGLLACLGGASGGDLSEVPNLVYRVGDEVRRSAVKTVEEISELPTPDYRDLLASDYLSPAPVLLLPASRGCYMKCAFCSISYATRGYRFRGAAAVVGDILDFQDQVGRDRHLYFDLAVDVLSPPDLNAMVDAMLAAELDVTWGGELRFEKTLTSAAIARLRRSGCRQLRLGLESGSDRVLKLMHKGIRLDRVVEILHDCRREDLKAVAMILIGFPGETEEDVRTTCDFLDEHEESIWSVWVHTYDLARGSVIEHRPEGFGVTLVADDAMFVQPSQDYDVGEGMAKSASRSAAEELRARLRARHPFAQAGLWATGGSFPLLINSTWPWESLRDYDSALRERVASRSGVAVSADAVPSLAASAVRFRGFLANGERPQPVTVVVDNGSHHTMVFREAAARFILAVDGERTLREVAQLTFGRHSPAGEVAVSEVCGTLAEVGLLALA